MGKSGCIGAVVLAAGRSSRMGDHKLLLPLGGRPLVRYAIEAACASVLDPIIVVLGHNADAVMHAVPPNRFQVVQNPAYAGGMAGSLRVGIAAVRADIGESMSGAFVMLADQPLVTSAWLNCLVEVAQSSPEAIVAASYGGRRGHPVYFPHALLPDLEWVEGDEGGRTVIQRNLDRLRLVECAAAEVGLDVDDPEDYARLVGIWDRLHPSAAS